MNDSDIIPVEGGLDLALIFQSLLAGSPENVTYCDPGNTVNTTYFYIWCIGAIFCIFFIAVQKRSNHCLQCCFGRPGLPVAIDFLVSPRNRVTYSILFSIMGYSLINTFGTLDVNLPGNNIYLSTFNKILLTPFVTVTTLVLQYYPLFTAVEFPHRRTGYLAGVLYSIAWFCIMWIPRFIVYHNYSGSCGTSVSDTTTIVTTAFQDVPLIIMSAFVVGWFVYKFAFFCIWRPMNKRVYFSDLGDLEDPKSGLRQYHVDHIKNLLKKQNTDNNKKNSVIFKVLDFILPFKRNYKLPLSFIGAVLAMMMITYQLTFGFIVSALTTSVQLGQNYNNLLRPIFSQFRTIDSTLQSIFVGIPIILVLAPILALLLNGFLLFHMVSSVSMTIKRAAKHGFEGNLPPRHLRLSAYWKYLGAQIGLFLVAWVFYFLIFLLVGIVLVILILLLIISSTTRGYAISILVTVGIPTLWSRILLISQNIIAKYIFLGDRNPDVKFIEIRHRRLYNWFGFVLFFYNGFAGLVSGIIRIVISAVFGIILLFRLDFQYLPSHLWWWDFGYKNYQGFLYMHYCYNNAVMLVFTHLMTKSAQQSASDEESKVELVGTDVLVKPHSRRARNRWLVAYTLIKNPSLQKYTANNILLLSRKMEVEKEKVFLLEHVIKNVGKAQEIKIAQEVNREKIEIEEMIGVELKPEDESKTPDEETEVSVPECAIEREQQQKKPLEDVQREKYEIEEMIDVELRPEDDPKMSTGDTDKDETLLLDP